MCFDVAEEVGGGGECAVTCGADVRFLAGVSALVDGGGGEGGESLVAECAVEGLLASVHAAVTHQHGGTVEGLRAVGARIIQPDFRRPPPSSWSSYLSTSATSPQGFTLVK